MRTNQPGLRKQPAPYASFRLFLLIVVGIGLLLPACRVLSPVATPPGNPPRVILNVFAAASLTEAFSEIGRSFEARHPGLTVVFNFAGSQQLAQQIANGAPLDVFASANNLQMDTAIQSGRMITSTVQTFVRNRLVIIVPASNPAGLSQLQDLSSPGLKLVLAAGEVPVGRYSLEFLDNAARDPLFGASFMENVLNNVVSYEQDVKFVLAKVSLGEADAGIVYISDITGRNASKVVQIEIPDSLNILAGYPIAVVNDSPNPALAQAFIDYVLSPEGQALLRQYGFLPVEK